MRHAIGIAGFREAMRTKECLGADQVTRIREGVGAPDAKPTHDAQKCGDSGSLTVELVVLAPVILVFALATLAFGRFTQARQQVVEAAQAGAQAAAVGSNADSAQQDALAAASTGILASAHTCENPQVNVNVSHFVPGGYVVVQVTCHVQLSDLLVPGLPGSTTVQASSTAPLDPYRSIP